MTQSVSRAIGQAATARNLCEGSGVLSDAELLALVMGRVGLGRGGLGPAARHLADRVLEAVGGLEGLSRVGASVLTDVPGVGKVQAARLTASVELGRRLRARASEPREPLSSPRAVAAYVGAHIGTAEEEQLWVLSLDGRNGLRGRRCVAKGGQHGLVVTAREILRAAISDAASGFILAHNHPSNEPEPSTHDIAMTRAVVAAAEVVGTPLLDHVIVTPCGRFSSFLDLGFLDGEAMPLRVE